MPISKYLVPQAFSIIVSTGRVSRTLYLATRWVLALCAYIELEGRFHDTISYQSAETATVLPID